MRIRQIVAAAVITYRLEIRSVVCIHVEDTQKEYVYAYRKAMRDVVSRVIYIYYAYTKTVTTTTMA